MEQPNQLSPHRQHHHHHHHHHQHHHHHHCSHHHHHHHHINIHPDHHHHNSIHHPAPHPHHHHHHHVFLPQCVIHKHNVPHNLNHNKNPINQYPLPQNPQSPVSASLHSNLNPTSFGESQEGFDEFEGGEDEDPVFVLTDEWKEFFAKSDAKRREAKKLARKQGKN